MTPWGTGCIAARIGGLPGTSKRLSDWKYFLMSRSCGSVTIAPSIENT